MHHTPLIATIVAGLVLAFVLGAIALRLRLSPLAGYLLAGVIVSPATPGFVADQELANQLAEIGVILLMFGVGLHFSMRDLLSVKNLAVPGAIAQITVATLLGMALAYGVGWGLMAGFVFGLALSVASTVVLLRALEDRRLVQTQRGKIAVGWLIVEDLAMVLALVLLPALAQFVDDSEGQMSVVGLGGILLLTLGKVAAFIAFMMIVGRRVIPRVLDWVAKTGSRELFSLSVLSLALGVALGAAALFDVSFALGAFFAGLIMHESPLAQRAAEESLPLRDAFAVLFFVSVGMLFDPTILWRALELLATLGIILIGKSIAAFFIVRVAGRSRATALTIAASLAQIGEFSFILAGLGVGLGLLNEEARALILAGAILSIVINPFAFRFVDRYVAKTTPPPEIIPAGTPTQIELQPTTLQDHAIVVGYGRVGAFVANALRMSGEPCLVIEDRRKPAKAAHDDGIELLVGNAAEPRVLHAANLAGARQLFVAIPRSFEAGQVVKQARSANPNLIIVARAHSDAELEHLQKCGATVTLMGEREIALGMLNLAHQLELPAPEAEAETPPTAPTPT